VRETCSPRHVPDEVFAIAEVPRTLSGKALEVPVKRILMGTPPDKAASRDSLANPAALDWFVDFAAELENSA
jgi:acetoacetyl-CoA synthetase